MTDPKHGDIQWEIVGERVRLKARYLDKAGLNELQEELDIILQVLERREQAREDSAETDETQP